VDGKKLAQILNGSDQILIEKISDTKYIISDLIVALFVGENDYKNFKEKWEGYKRNGELPNIEKGDIYINKGEGFSKIEQSIPLPDNRGKKAEITNLQYKNSPIFVADNNIGSINADYLEFLADSCDFYYDEIQENISIIKEDELIGIIKPYDLFTREHEEIVKTIKKFENVLDLY
jgi:signal peptidase I